MMTPQEIKEGLAFPCGRWEAEPLLGSIYGQEELDAVTESIKASMDFRNGFGFSSEPIFAFEKAMADYVGVRYAIAVNSCGPGMDIVMRSLHLQPGEEVIVPSINYDAAPLCVLGAGGNVVWGESRAEDYMLDPADVERKITPNTRAILAVSIHGLTPPMDEYLAIAARHPHPKWGPPKVILDAARAVGGDYKGTKTGKFGYATIYSFHTMKNMTTLGEGGMIVTDDEALNKFAHGVRMYGRFEHAWGTSNVMTKVQAAVGLVQLKKLDSFIAGRRRVAKERNELLKDVPEFTLPADRECREHTFYLYALTMCDAWAGYKRDKLVEMMRERYSIICWVANPPIYTVNSYVAEKCGTNTPYSEQLAEHILCIPIHPAMTTEENRHICAALLTCIEELR